MVFLCWGVASEPRLPFWISSADLLPSGFTFSDFSLLGFIYYITLLTPMVHTGLPALQCPYGHTPFRLRWMYIPAARCYLLRLLPVILYLDTTAAITYRALCCRWIYRIAGFVQHHNIPYLDAVGLHLLPDATSAFLRFCGAYSGFTCLPPPPPCLPTCHRTATAFCRSPATFQIPSLGFPASRAHAYNLRMPFASLLPGLPNRPLGFLLVFASCVTDMRMLYGFYRIYLPASHHHYALRMHLIRLPGFYFTIPADRSPLRFLHRYRRLDATTSPPERCDAGCRLHCLLTPGSTFYRSGSHSGFTAFYLLVAGFYTTTRA